MPWLQYEVNQSVTKLYFNWWCFFMLHQLQISVVDRKVCNSIQNIFVSFKRITCYEVLLVGVQSNDFLCNWNTLNQDWTWDPIKWCDTLTSQQSLHTSPSWASHGLSIMNIVEKTDCIITAPHCDMHHLVLRFIVVILSVLLGSV